MNVSNFSQIMEDSQDICGIYSPSIYAKDPNFCSPTEGLGKYVQEEMAKKAAQKKKQKRDAARRNRREAAALTSYVITKDQRKGKRLIQIQVVDLENEAAAYLRSSADTTQCSEYSDNDSVILSAQYVMRDSIDEIMEHTESLIRTISRKITSDDYF